MNLSESRREGERESEPSHFSSKFWNPEISSDFSLDMLLESLESNLDGLGSSEDQGVGIFEPFSPSKARRVRFFPEAEAKLIPDLHEIKESDLIDVIWYSRQELRNIRRECFQTIKLLAAGQYLGDDDWGYCSRGVEYKLPGKYEERQAIKERLWRAVLEEQFVQREVTGDDPNLLARISRERSAQSAKEALSRGLTDEHAARET